MTLDIAVEAFLRMIGLIALILLLRILIDKAVIDSVQLYRSWKKRKNDLP